MQRILYSLLAIINGSAVIGMFWDTPYRDGVLLFVCVGLAFLVIVPMWRFIMCHIIDPLGSAIGEFIEWISGHHDYWRSKR